MGSMNQGSLRFPAASLVRRALNLTAREMNVHLGKKLAGLFKIEIVRSLTGNAALASWAAFR
jgi:hypothetical protein